MYIQRTIKDICNWTDLRKEMEEPTYIERGHNPNCGDDLTLEIKLKEDKIEDASFLGNGCAISSASTAMLIDLIKGKTVAEAEEKVNLFFKMMSLEEGGLTSEESKKLGDAVLMEYVAKMPARVKCATLSWHSMKVII